MSDQQQLPWKCIKLASEALLKDIYAADEERRLAMLDTGDLGARNLCSAV